MKHVNLDAYDEAVKQFVLSLKPEAGGSILELGGQAVVQVLPLQHKAETTDVWNEDMDARRCDLIDREIVGSLTNAEAGELRTLQAAMLRHRRRVAPLPIGDARRLHQELLVKATNEFPT